MRQPATLRSFFDLFRIPSLRIVTTFVAVCHIRSVPGLHMAADVHLRQVHVGLARAGFEASVYPQIGTLVDCSPAERSPTACTLGEGGAVLGRIRRVCIARRLGIYMIGVK